MSIKLELTEAEAEWLASLTTLTDSDSVGAVVIQKCEGILAVRRSAARRVALGLPWRPFENPGFGQPPFAWGIEWEATAGSAPLVPQGLTEAQARLMAAAPDLARALENVISVDSALRFYEGNREHEHAELTAARAVLKKAGW